MRSIQVSYFMRPIVGLKPGDRLSSGIPRLFESRVFNICHSAIAPLARMLPGRRPEAPKKADPKDTETANVTVSIPAALRDRARAACKATGMAKGTTRGAISWPRPSKRKQPDAKPNTTMARCIRLGGRNSPADVVSRTAEQHGVVHNRRLMRPDWPG